MLKSLRSIAIAMVSFVLLGACVELSTSNPTATPTAEGAAAQEASPTPTATSQSLISGAVETPHTPTAFGSTRVGQPFVLDGTPSVDDRVISTFTWVQVRGPHVPLIAGDPHTPLLSVVPQQAGAYVFELVVTDNSGLISVPQTATFVVGNDPPEVRVTSPSTGIVGWNVAVQFKLADSTADLANIKVEYSVDGGHTFSPATPSAASSTGDPDRPVVIGSVPNTGGVSTNPEGSAAGAEHSFLWDTAHDLGATVQDVVVRVTPIDSEAGAAAAGPFTYHPLLDEVTAACGVPDEDWDPILDGWGALQTTLAACQDRLVASLAQAADALHQASSIPDPTGIEREATIIDVSALAGAANAQVAAVGPIRWMAPESLSRSYTETQVQVVTLEQQLSGIGNDAQLANIDLKNALQQQQQMLQTISNVSKVLHDTAMAVIRKIG